MLRWMWIPRETGVELGRANKGRWGEMERIVIQWLQTIALPSIAPDV